MAADLETAASHGGACLIAATAMGGRFASDGNTGADFFPGQGAIAGLIKTIAREWTSVRTRVIDLDLEEGTTELADRITAEVFHDDAWSEVGYAGGRRIRLRATPAPLVLKGRRRTSRSPRESQYSSPAARVESRRWSLQNWRGDGGQRSSCSAPPRPRPARSTPSWTG